jgi:hypothetical protein
MQVRDESEMKGRIAELERLLLTAIESSCTKVRVIIDCGRIP